MQAEKIRSVDHVTVVKVTGDPNFPHGIGFKLGPPESVGELILERVTMEDGSVRLYLNQPGLPVSIGVVVNLARDPGVKLTETVVNMKSQLIGRIKLKIQEFGALMGDDTVRNRIH